jgi:hypothetical protein
MIEVKLPLLLERVGVRTLRNMEVYLKLVKLPLLLERVGVRLNK